MKHLISMTVAAFVLAGVLGAKTTIYVGLPASMDKTAQDAAWSSTFKLIDGSEPGTEIVLMNGWDLRWVRTIVVPDAKPGKSRHRRLRKDISAFTAFLRSAGKQTPGAEGWNAILQPQFLTMVGAERALDENARCLLIGSAFYKNPKDQAFMMGEGLYPSDGHLSNSRSIYSCVGKEQLLEDCLVAYCYLDEGSFQSTPERTKVRAWWTKYIAACGGTLVHASASSSSAVKAVLRGQNRPAVPNAVVDATDRRVAMLHAEEGLRVEVSGQPIPVVVKHADPAPAANYGFAVIVDGSISCEEQSTAVAALLPEFAGHLTRQAAVVRLGLVMARDAKVTDVWPLTEMDPTGRGRRAFDDWMTEEPREAFHTTFAPGAETGVRQGTKSKVTRLKALGARVDLTNAVGHALAMLEASSDDGTVPVLAIVGDVATQEEGEDLSPTDRKRADALLERVSLFVHTHPNAHLVVIDGSEAGSKTEIFFKNFVAASAFGVHTKDIKELKGLLYGALAK